MKTTSRYLILPIILFSLSLVNSIQCDDNNTAPQLHNTELGELLFNASQKISGDLMIQPDEDPQALKKRVLYLLVYEQPLLEALILTAQTLKDNPLPVDGATFDTELLIKTVNELLTYIRSLSLSELSPEEQDAIEKIQDSTRVLVDLGSTTTMPSTTATVSAAAIGGAWKMVFALGVIFVGYRVIQKVTAKKELDGEEYMNKLRELSKENAEAFSKLKTAQAQLKEQLNNTDERINDLNSGNTDIARQEAELQGQERLLRRLLSDTTDLQNAVVRKEPSLFSRFFGRKQTNDTEEPPTPASSPTTSPKQKHKPSATSKKKKNHDNSNPSSDRASDTK